MGKPTLTKKKPLKGCKASESKPIAGPKGYDEDTRIFIDMSRDMKEEGNKLFQKRDYEGAISIYEKSIKLLPKSHIDVACLHSSLAACYMQMAPPEYREAIKECNLALEVSPRYTKALLKRARCLKALNMMEFACKDIDAVLALEPNNATALEISEVTKNSIDKVVVEEVKLGDYDESMRVVKLVFGDDIRCVRIPAGCSIAQLKDVVRSRFPRPKHVLIKYKDDEDDLVTIATSEDLRWVEGSMDPHLSIKLHIVEVSPEHELDRSLLSFSDNGNDDISPCVDSWIIEFASLFKNYVGFSSDSYLDLRELGIKFYSEAIEEVVTSEEAQEIFATSEEKFQEMAALALFNWGNVHMSHARKRLLSFEQAQGEYDEARKRYDDALKIKPDFYEGLLALGQLQFEQAKLFWYDAIEREVDLDADVLEMFNNAEDNMEKGMAMWEEMEKRRMKNLAKPNKEKELLAQMGVCGIFRDISRNETIELSSSIRSQINSLWGTMLYERSIVEFRLGLPEWEECLMEAVEKFKLVGASPTDLAVMIKNHIANETTQEGMGFKIDEIVQAWNEMNDGKKWIRNFLSYRLEPLFRRRLPKFHHVSDHT